MPELSDSAAKYFAKFGEEPINWSLKRSTNWERCFITATKFPKIMRSPRWG